MQQVSHKQSLYRIFFAIILLFSTLPIFSQGVVQYPVQVSTVVLPNPPMYLSAYSGVETDKLSVTLLNRDTQQSSLQVKLRMRIYCSQGQEISTRAESHYTPITLEGGIPLRLSMSDLAAYFRTENLRIAGSLPQGKLPVGHTRFCFEVLEYYTGRLLSSQGCGSAFIVLQTPPLLQQPSHGSLLTDDPTGGILFRWSPQHSVGLERVQYEFILKEMFDTQQSAELGFAHGVEVYRTHTTATSLLYGMMHPPLIAGKRYVWQVRAFTDPISGTPLAFENNGQSRVFTFDIDYPCQAPQHIIATAHTNGIHLTWDASPHPSASYHLSYRRKDFSSTWHQAVITSNSYTISNLTPGANYEYKVGISCTNKTNDIHYSTVAHIAYNPDDSETPPTSIQTKVKECGKSRQNNISNTEPKETLWAGDVIYAGDFTITLSTVQGSNGRFTGEGKVHVPYLSGIGMSVYFSDISINTDNQLIEGKIHTVYDESRGTIIDLDAFDHGGTTTPAQGVLVPSYEFDFALTDVTRIHYDPHTNSLIFYDATGSRVGNYELTGTAPSFPVLVSDKEGNMYSINETNKDNPPANYTLVAVGKQIGELAGNAFDRNVVDSHKGTVTFFDEGVGTYSFDKFLPPYDNINYIRYSSENGNERLYPQLGDNYYVPWKFIPLNTHDKVQAMISLDPNSELQPERVVFITESGTQVPASYNASTYQVSVTGTSNSGVHTLYALYPKGDGTSYFHLGQLRIDSRPPQHLKLVLVYAGGSYDKTAIANELNTIYNRVGIHWQVSEVQNFTYDKETIKTLFDNKSGLLSAYNDRMTSLNQALQSHLGDSYQSDACYVFMADASQAGNDRDVVGFMPRGRQYGYIYTKDLNASKIGSILAHELAHGKFKLYHTFDNIYAGKLAQGSTTNLMDYSEGTHLAKWQWNQLYDPAILNGVFDRDERAMIAGGWAITPDYKYFVSIPNTNVVANIANKPGTLSGFILNGITYTWNGHKYVSTLQNSNENVYTLKSIELGLADNSTVWLLYDLEKGCNGGTSLDIRFEDLKRMTQTGIETFIQTNTLPRQKIECITGNIAIERAYQIISNDNSFLDLIKKLKSSYEEIMSFYTNCSQQEWQPGKSPGLIPKCFWEDISISSQYYYTNYDIAYISGVVDGGYAELVAINDLVTFLFSGKIEKTIRDLAYAYTLAYLQCNNIHIKVQEYDELLNKLASANSQGGVYGWLQEVYYQPKIDKLGEKIQKCSDATELRNNISDTLDNIIELVNNYDELKQIIHTFAKDLSDYYQLVTSTTNDGRYEAGRLLIPVASTVIPIVGQIGKTAKVSKIKDALKAIRQSTKSQLDELNQALVTKARGAGVNGAGKWLDDLDILLGSGTKTKINNWINNGLSESKLQTAFANSTDKAGLLNKLETSKSIYHQRVHIADWDNIPGVVKSDFTPNGLTSGKTHSLWNNPALDLPIDEAKNFVNATAVELPAGTKIYRVTGGNPSGAYWTIQKPNSVGEVIGGTAVQPAWNDFSKIYVYEVPQGQTLKVWQGTTARQPIAQGINNPHLPGGEQQLFIPEVVRDNAFKNLVQETILPW